MPDIPAKRIIHLDMDAFYASIEQHDNPSLQGRPVIVGGGGNRGVVCASSYEARTYGVHSAMALVTARQRCPKGVFLPVRMGRYQEVSRAIMAIFHRYTPLVEPLSLDEAFLDVTASEGLFGPAEDIAGEIKQKVRAETGLTVSAGVAATKMAAKIASDLRKPDGLTLVPPGGERNFLAPLPIEKLWGVGKTTQGILRKLNVVTIGDLCRVPLAILVSKCGSLGEQLHWAALGIDDREVVPEREMKSFGAEETFARDLQAPGDLEDEILALAVRVGRRLRRHGMVGKTITLKVKYADFVQLTRSQTIPVPTNDHGRIFRLGCELLRKITATGSRPVRLLGIALSNLSPAGSLRQMTLFDTDAGEDKTDGLNRALDQITEKFGTSAIRPARIL